MPLMEPEKPLTLKEKEEETALFWKKENIFSQSISRPAPQGDFVFYDGPPFATGVPHYGHVVPGTIKDIIPRFRTMQGFRVARTWGWDCHGLPVENIVEKELGLNSKKDIEAHGIASFNERSRKVVMRHASDWRDIIPRLGRWVDMDNDYQTLDASYTESVWWVFKSLHERGLIYEGFRSMHLCPRCETTLSNFEVNLGYRDITDQSVFTLFPRTGKQGSFLVWTTTPWTLPGNTALAVNPDFTYVLVDQVKSQDGVASFEEPIILAKERIEDVLHGYTYRIIEEFSGDTLVGDHYEPPFSYAKDPTLEGYESGWRVYPASFVTQESGTGIVHIAPAFGEDDYTLSRKYKLPFIQHVNRQGRFVAGMDALSGLKVKPKGDHTETDQKIITLLKEKKSLFGVREITHAYPFCWRCETPLLNYATSSWFVNIQKIKQRMLHENEQVSWVPSSVGTGRFKNSISDAPDWAISRSRFWGAPMPVWKNVATGKQVIIGSFDELKKYTKKSGNNYLVMRHGESESNINGVVSSDVSNEHHLTEKGKQEAVESAQSLKNASIDLVIASDLVRTKETAYVVARELGLPQEKVLFDSRIREIQTGIFNGKPIEDYQNYFSSIEEKYHKQPNGGESVSDMRKRVGAFLYELEEKYHEKNILIVTHEYGVWLIEAVSKGYNEKETIALKKDRDDFVKTGEVRKFDFTPLPHNTFFERDLHRPYIDTVKLMDKDGTALERIPDVFDCWFESGSMPYGMHHYPFKKNSSFNPHAGWFRKSRGFPADFIAEGLDQTRGWFYSLMAISVGLFKKAPYQHVVTNGLVLAEDGRKMSKSLKNYPDLMGVVDRYGADALRYYLMASPIVRGEDLCFSEKGVDEVMKKLIIRLDNVVSFYALYQKDTPPHHKSSSPLDQWILNRLYALTSLITRSFEAYEIDRGVRPISDFIDDLSTWYIRRSRNRFKEEGSDKENAEATLRFVLHYFSRLIAPVMPFLAERTYQAVRTSEDEVSVHLTSWPKERAYDEGLLNHMAMVREITSLGLLARARAEIKIRQPLRALFVPEKYRVLPKTLLSLVAEELNIKEIEPAPHPGTEVTIDTHITQELREEGAVRELIRSIQDFRKQSGLTPKDFPRLMVSSKSRGQTLFEKNKNEIKEATHVRELHFKQMTEGKKIVVENEEFIIAFEE